MKITSNLTHVATEIEFEAPLNEEELLAVFQKSGVQGFPAELDIAERTEDHVQMMSLDGLLGFAKASGLSAVTYDVTYFPHADDAEVAYQLRQLARDLEISAEVIRDVCAAEIQEYPGPRREARRRPARPQHRGGLHGRHRVRLVRHRATTRASSASSCASWRRAVRRPSTASIMRASKAQVGYARRVLIVFCG